MASSHRDWLIALVLTGITLLAYAPVVRNGFVNLDDEAYVTSNRMVQEGLTVDGFLWAFTAFHASNWHPLTWLSLQLDASLCNLLGKGLNATVFHLINLLLHTANGVLLFLALRRMTGAVWRSALVAALFAVHPLHVESVAWVAERKDVLSTFFWILTMGLYAWYAERRSWGRYLLVLLSFALGLLAKPMLVTLPCVLLLLDYWPLRRLSFSPSEDSPPAPVMSLMPEKLPLFALALASSLVTLFAQERGGAMSSWESLPLETRAANALVAYLRYLGMTFWPMNLAVYYPYSREGLRLWTAAAAGLILLAITVLALAERRRRPYLLVGWLWFVGTLVPVIGLIQVGDQALADRYTYVPHIGLFLALVWGLADVLETWQNQVKVLGAGAVLAACMVLTWIQVGYWRDTLTLWDHTLRVTTNNYRGEASVGYTLYEQERWGDAIPHLKKALEIQAGDPELAFALADSYLRLDIVDEAIPRFQAVLNLEATQTPAYFKLRPAAHVKLSQAYGRKDKGDEARKHLEKAIQLNPANADAQNMLGWLYLQKGESDNALVSFTAALRYNARHSRALQGQGVIALGKNNLEDAIERFTQAVQVDPQSPEANYYLGKVLGQKGKWDEALPYLQTARQLAQAAKRMDLVPLIEEQFQMYRERPLG